MKKKRGNVRHSARTRRAADEKKAIKPKLGPNGTPLQWTIVSKVWAWVSVAAVIVGLPSSLIYFKPAISIEPGPNIDPSREYATTVVVTNHGNFTLRSLRFECGFGVGGGPTLLKGTYRTPDLRPLDVLEPGQPITRSCDVGDLSVTGDNSIKFTVTYKWLFLVPETESRIFTLRKGNPGYFLVPDAV